MHFLISNSHLIWFNCCCRAEHQMFLYQPSFWVKIFYNELADKLLKQKYLSHTLIIFKVTNEIKTMKLRNEMSSLHKCCYSSDKQLTAQRMKVMINAETVLNTLWTKINKHFLIKTEESFMKSHMFSSQRQTEWDSYREHWNKFSQYFYSQRCLHKAVIEPFSVLDWESHTNITIFTD